MAAGLKCLSARFVIDIVSYFRFGWQVVSACFLTADGWRPRRRRISCPFYSKFRLFHHLTSDG